MKTSEAFVSGQGNWENVGPGVTRKILGFDDELMRQVTKRLAGGGGKEPTAHVGTTDTDLRAATWFAPRFVVEVFYRGIGRQQLLRQPSLKAVRTDKDIADLADSDRSERPAKTTNLAKAGRTMKKTAKKKAADERRVA